MEAKSLIFKFIENLSIKEQEKILGIIFYGSYKYKTYTKNSDIDLLLVTEDTQNYKGVIYLENKKIEYFEKNIYYLIESIENLSTNPNRSMISIFKNGEIIYSKNQVMEILKEQILMESKRFPKKKERENPHHIKTLYTYMNSLNNNSKLFEYIFYNLLECIRKQYHEENGFSQLPSMKIHQLYSNPKYAKDLYCVKLPDKDFIDVYLKLITEGYQEEQLDSLLNLIHEKEEEQINTFTKYTKQELKYQSTIVKNKVDKSWVAIENNQPAFLSSYYIALEETRQLYCRINNLQENLTLLDQEEYDTTFLTLFSACLGKEKRKENLTTLFEYVTDPLEINYQNYKILELS